MTDPILREDAFANGRARAAEPMMQAWLKYCAEGNQSTHAESFRAGWNAALATITGGKDD